MSDLKKLQYTIESCNHCGQCKWLLPSRMNGWDFAAMCPIHNYFHFDAYSGQGMLNIAAGILNESVACSEELARMLHTCTGCGACDINCKNVRDMEVLDTIYELRRETAEAGCLPPTIREKADRIVQTHHLIASDSEIPIPDEWICKDETCDTLLFAGCSASGHPETVLAAARILRAGGIPFRVLGKEEWCCGAYLWRSGLYAEAKELIERNVQLFRKLGIRRIITACAECFGSFRNGYPRFTETSFETLHISQVAAELIQSGKLRIKPSVTPMKVAFHDPCMLGRLSEAYTPWEGEIQSYGLHVPEKQWRRGEKGVYEAPRTILKAIPGIEVKELIRGYEESWCCGYNAEDMEPEFARETAGERLREAAHCGAEYVVSSCPFCKEALDRDNPYGIKYLDLTELLAERLEENT